MISSKFDNKLLLFGLFLFLTVSFGTSELTCVMMGSPDGVPVPESWINDGYCDCPLDGSDEPNTSACSGAPEGWAGAALDGASIVHDPRTFVCPQQPDIILPLSRINDRICDCCDGSDEGNNPDPSFSCPDNCDTVLAESRRRRAMLQIMFMKGYEQRLSDLAAFRKLEEEVLSKINAIKSEDLQTVLSDIADVEQQEKEEQLQARTELRNILNVLVGANNSGTDDISEVFHVMTQEEMANMVIELCLLSGEADQSLLNEMDQYYEENSDLLGNDRKNKKQRRGICPALQNAGLDLGYIWQEETLGEIVCRSMDENIPVNKASSPKKYKDRNTDAPYQNDACSLSSTRATFRNHAKAVLDKITSILDVDNDPMDSSDDDDRERRHDHDHLDDFSDNDYRERNYHDHLDDLHDDEPYMEEEENSVEEEEKLNDEPTQQNIDPIALQQVQRELRERVDSIERGNQYAQSAKLMVEAFKKFLAYQNLTLDVEQEWRNLALATLWHSRVGSEDMVDILYSTLAEFSNNRDESVSNSCSGVNISFCSFSLTNISRGHLTVPSPSLQQAAIARCEERIASSSTDSSNTCRDNDANAEGEVEVEIEVPSHVNDGYYGYYKFLPRDETQDQISIALSSLSNVGDKAKNTMMHTALSELRDTEQNLEKMITDLEEEIGGPDRIYGTDGILYSIKDQCYVVTAGNYDYEVCLFGSAWQRDVGSKDKGTSLGSWEGLQLDKTNNTPQMVWNGGTKCWNGPQRSATVSVSCGSDTKLISAEEPQTCQYEMELKSPIACDDVFGRSHGFEL